MIEASDHLKLTTWPRRGDTDEDPRCAWWRGAGLDVGHATRGYDRVPNHDEARFDAETLTVLFRRGDTLTTCYSVRKPDITNDHGQAVREAVETQHGPIEAHHSQTDSDCDMEFTDQ